jgi:hypothetical protein
MRRGLVRSAAPVDPSWSATTIAILSLAIGCGQIRTIADSDGTSVGDAGEAVATARDASEAVDAPDAPETSLPDAGPDAARCPSDVIFMAVQADDPNLTATTLQTFAPATGVVTKLGPIACATTRANVVSLAVDQTGTVYIYNLGVEIERVDTTTLACAPGPPAAQTLLPGSIGYQPLDIAFVGDGTRDVLYANFFGASTLATIDLESGALQATPDEFYGQLAGTGDGRLFVGSAESETVVEVDPTTGTVVQSFPFQTPPDSGFIYLNFTEQPIAVWNDEIYTFAQDFLADAGKATEIDRFRPSDGSRSTLATVAGAVVGASAATCLPSP